MGSVSNDNKIKIWDLKKGSLDWTLYGHTGEIKSLNFSEKGDSSQQEVQTNLLWFG